MPYRSVGRNCNRHVPKLDKKLLISPVGQHRRSCRSRLFSPVEAQSMQRSPGGLPLSVLRASLRSEGVSLSGRARSTAWRRLDSTASHDAPEVIFKTLNASSSVIVSMGGAATFGVSFNSGTCTATGVLWSKRSLWFADGRTVPPLRTRCTFAKSVTARGTERKASSASNKRKASGLPCSASNMASRSSMRR